METLEKHSGLQARLLKSKRLSVQIKIVGNATPASKTRSNDLAGVALVIAQGQTSDAPAGVVYVAPDDATGKYSLILDKDATGEIEKVQQCSAVNITGTHTVSASVSEGHIVIDIDSSADLTSANSEVRLLIDYQKK